jgi:RNA recognition motif-containing protein
MNLFVSGLATDVEDTDLQNLFEEYGSVASAKVIKDRHSGVSRGFGFVEMPNKMEAQLGIDGLHRKTFKGKVLRVVEARRKK